MPSSSAGPGNSRMLRKRAPNLPGAVLDELAVEALGASAAPLSAYDIAERLAGLGKGPSKVAAVYRSLGRLCAKGQVARVETLSAYRLQDQAKTLLLIEADGHATTALPIDHLYDSLAARVIDAGFKLERLVLEAVVTTSRSTGRDA